MCDSAKDATPKFKDRQIVKTILNQEKVMILEVWTPPIAGISYQGICYYVRTSDYREIYFREYELEEIIDNITVIGDSNNE